MPDPEVFTANSERPDVTTILVGDRPDTGVLEAVSAAANQEEQSPNLEAYRNRVNIRGNDEAVLEVGTAEDKQRLAGVLSDPAHHSRNELLDAVMSNYSGEAYGDVQWSKTSGGWGTPKEITQYGTLRQDYPALAPLSLDAGFMTHLPEFMDMVDKGEIDTTDPVAARAALKEKLGDKVVWRGTMLSDEELKLAKETGLLSPLSKIVETSDQPQSQFEAVALSTFASHAIEKHFHGEHRSKPLLSVSEHEDVAIAVGRHFGDRIPGKKFYLFKIKLPAIDLISYQDHALRTPSKLQESLDRNPNYSLKVSVDGKESEHKWDQAVESYVFWKINPEDILEVTQPNVSESAWNNQTTRSQAVA